MRYFLPVFLCACLGRVNPKDEPTHSGQETGETGAPPHHVWSVALVDPPSGSTAGGDTLVIRGEGFKEEMEVRIGGKKATVDQWSVEELTVFSPSAQSAGSVDVVVLFEGEEALLPEGFVYFQDASGLASGFGLLNRTFYTGGYWAGVENNASGFFAFLEEPQDIHIGDVIWGVREGCVVDEPSSFPAAAKVDANVLALEKGYTRIELGSKADGYFENDAIDLSRVDSYATYGLEAIINPQGIELATSEFVKTSGAFSIDNPVVNGGALMSIDQSGLQFDWSGSNGDWMMGRFSLACYNSEGNLEWPQSVACGKVDSSGTGSFLLDSSIYTKWENGCFLFVSMTSINLAPEGGPFILPHDRSELRMAGSYTIVGALVTQ
jgi:hypothetical protein